jgi:phage head maturation protease
MAKKKKSKDGSFEFERMVAIDRADVDGDASTIDLSFSSETPVRDMFGPPVVLLHEKTAVDFSHLRDIGSILVNHDRDQIVAAPEDVTLDEGERKARAKIRFGTDEESQRIFQKVKEGLIRGVSVGYRAEKAQVLEEGESWSSPTSKRSWDGPMIIATKWQPREISLTPIPADGTVGVGRTEEDVTMTDEFKDVIRKQLTAKGLPEDATDEDVQTFIANLRAEDDEPGFDETDLERAGRDATKAERERVAELQKLATLAKDEEALGDWIRKGYSPDQVRRQVLDKMIELNPPLSKPSGVEVAEDSRDKFNDTFEVILGRRIKRSSSLLSKIPVDTERQIDVAGDLNLCELYRRFLIRDRVTGAANMSREQLATNYMAGRRAFQHSTSDFTNILANTLRKSLHVGFNDAPTTYQIWTGSASLPDFKQADRDKLSEAADFAETPELMPIAETTVSDTKEVWQLKTYANRIGFSRQAMINDDLGAFGRIPQLLGAASARTVDKLVYNILLTPPTMNEDSIALFATTHTSGSNLHTTALGLAGLNAARVLMREAVGLNSQILDILPRFVVVPVELESTAYQNVQGTFVANTVGGIRARWIGELEVIASPRLTNAKDWFLCADPATIDTIVVAGLNSTSVMPEIQRLEGTDILGVEWVAYFDAAVAALEHRGLVMGDVA